MDETSIAFIFQLFVNDLLAVAISAPQNLHFA